MEVAAADVEVHHLHECGHAAVVHVRPGELTLRSPGTLRAPATASRVTAISAGGHTSGGSAKGSSTRPGRAMGVKGSGPRAGSWCSNHWLVKESGRLRPPSTTRPPRPGSSAAGRTPAVTGPRTTYPVGGDHPDGEGDREDRGASKRSHVPALDGTNRQASSGSPSVRPQATRSCDARRGRCREVPLAAVSHFRGCRPRGRRYEVER